MGESPHWEFPHGKIIKPNGGLSVADLLIIRRYPLVNIQKAIENGNF
jgi:hypothetical protein